MIVQVLRFSGPLSLTSFDQYFAAIENRGRNCVRWKSTGATMPTMAACLHTCLPTLGTLHDLNLSTVFNEIDLTTASKRP
jgi:hypothetical protein